MIRACLTIAAALCLTDSMAIATPGGCRWSIPADIGQRPTRWLGSCRAGAADGLGILRAGTREPYDFFLGRMVRGRPHDGLMIGHGTEWLAASGFDRTLGRSLHPTSGPRRRAARNADASIQAIRLRHHQPSLIACSVMGDIRVIPGRRGCHPIATAVPDATGERSSPETRVSQKPGTNRANASLCAGSVPIRLDPRRAGMHRRAQFDRRDDKSSIEDVRTEWCLVLPRRLAVLVDVLKPLVLPQHLAREAVERHGSMVEPAGHQIGRSDDQRVLGFGRGNIPSLAVLPHSYVTPA